MWNLQQEKFHFPTIGKKVLPHLLLFFAPFRGKNKLFARQRSDFDAFVEPVALHAHALADAKII